MIDNVKLGTATGWQQIDTLNFGSNNQMTTVTEGWFGTNGQWNKIFPFGMPLTLAISHDTGTYTAAIDVTLTPSETADIYYTLDGSEPTVLSTLYTAPIHLPPLDVWLNITAPSYISPTQTWQAHWDGVKWLNDYDYVIYDSYSGAPFYLSSVNYGISLSKIRIEYDLQGRQGHLVFFDVNGLVITDVPYNSLDEYIVDPTFKIKTIMLYSDVSYAFQGIITKIEVQGYTVINAPTWTNITAPSYLTPTSTNMSAAHWVTDRWVSDYPSDYGDGGFRFEYNTGTFSCDFMAVTASFNYIRYAMDVVNFSVEFYDINNTFLGGKTYSEFSYEWDIDPTWQIKFINFAVPSYDNSGEISLINVRSLVQN
jgi:hypothetical protein